MPVPTCVAIVWELAHTLFEVVCSRFVINALKGCKVGGEAPPECGPQAMRFLKDICLHSDSGEVEIELKFRIR